MVKRVGSSRRKTRAFFIVPKKMKGRLPVSGFIKEFEMGESVRLKLKPAIGKGIYFRRFRGRIGMVEGKQGSCYKVRIMDGGKKKTLIVAPVHLEKNSRVK